jgi:hypothetical protein
MPSSTNKQNSNKLTAWELLFIFLGFISIVTLIISVYVSYTRDAFYPPWGPVAYGGPWGGPASGGPWNIPTRYPIRGWGWDIRGYPAAYPIDYGYYGYPGGQPAYPAPQPDGANSGTAIGPNAKSDSAAPFGIQMKPTTTKPRTNKSQSNNQSQNDKQNDKRSDKQNDKRSDKQNDKRSDKRSDKQNEINEEETAEELYQRESKWWPDWVSWPWYPYFNYGLHYDVNGKLKPSNNDSIPANHAWSWW